MAITDQLLTLLQREITARFPQCCVREQVLIALHLSATIASVLDVTLEHVSESPCPIHQEVN